MSVQQDELNEARAMLDALRAAIARPDQTRNCNRHPDAPHGFDRSASHNYGRYVCECENWTPGEAS